MGRAGEGQPAAGARSIQRVHVITEPLTPAMQQELTEGYEGNVAAGEDIGIVPVAGPGEWPDGMSRARLLAVRLQRPLRDETTSRTARGRALGASATRSAS